MSNPVLRDRVVAAIASERDRIIDVAMQIHGRPEVRFKEEFASRLLSEQLAAVGFAVESGVGNLPTAFTATATGRASGPTIAIIAEYDALPGLGHGCGHNLIAASALAAGIGLKAALADVGGVVKVIGTPAEEGGGGKAIMIDHGVFAGVDAALMTHHAGHRNGCARAHPNGTCLAVKHMIFEFFGKTAHAAADPHLGANALNACIKLFTGIDALRQHMRPDARVHGIITHGGEAPNIVPDYARARFYIRGADKAYVEELAGKIGQIAEGAALMTGTTTKYVDDGPMYLDVRPSYAIGARYADNMAACGLRVDSSAREGRGPYSTDFGNISYIMPVASGSFAISETPITGHSVQVVAGSKSDLGLDNTMKVSQAMALTALELLTEPALLAAAKAEHAKWETGELGG